MSNNPLFTGPRLFQNVTFHRHTDRSVGWLELFYDLVYVATLIQIGNFLSDNLTLEGFGQFLVMMFVVWWSWTGETFYQNRFVVDDLLHRIMVFIQMFAVATLGLSVSGAFGDLYVQFTLAYVVIRVVLVLMYVRIMLHPDGESDDLCRGYATGFSLGILIWLGSLLLPEDIHWVGWLVAIAVEFFTPLTPKLRRMQQVIGVDHHHLSERFGIFTIIVLGESFVKILDDAQGTQISIDTMAFSTVGLLVVYSLWWLYFSDTTETVVNYQSALKPIMFIYGHFPLSVGLVAFGVAAKKAFAEAAAHPTDYLKEEYRILYMVSIVAYLIAVALIDYGTEPEGETENFPRIGFRVVGAVLVLCIGLFMTGATATGFVSLIASVMVAQVLFSIWGARRDTEGTHGRGHHAGSGEGEVSTIVGD